MKQGKLELLTGCFVLAGLAAAFYLAVRVGGADWMEGDKYRLEARFGNISGVNEGSRVEISGVPVGTVGDIELNDNFYAIVTLVLPSGLRLDDDTIASVKTSGLIGDRFIELSPGGSGIPLEPGGMIVDTESALDIEDLISRMALGGIDEKKE